MKKRIDKKFHKFWLESGVIDVSQVSYWREKLFNAEYNEAFPINKDNLEGLYPEVAKAIKKYNLSYMAAKVQPHEAESWLSESGFTIFKFWATKHPSVKMYSGNNPNVI